MNSNDVLKLSKNLYGAIPALLDGMPMGFAVMRVLIDEEDEPFDFIYEYANNVYAYLENISLDNLKQYSWGQLFPEEDMQIFAAYANIALNGGSRIIEELEEDGDKKLRIHCYQPSYGYCAMVVEEVLSQEKSVPKPQEEDDQMVTQLLDEEQLARVERVVAQAEIPEPIQQDIVREEVPLERTEPAPLERMEQPQEAVQGQVQQENNQTAGVQQIAPQQTAPQQGAPEIAKEVSPEGSEAAPLERVEQPQETAPEPVQQGSYPAPGVQEAAPEPVQQGSYPAPGVQEAAPEPVQQGSYPAAGVQEAAPELVQQGSYPAAGVQEAAPEPVQQGSYPTAGAQETAPEPAQQGNYPAAEIQEEPAQQEVVTGGVTISNIVEERKPEGYTTIADMMASAALHREEPSVQTGQYQQEPVPQQENVKLEPQLTQESAKPEPQLSQESAKLEPQLSQNELQMSGAAAPSEAASDGIMAETQGGWTELGTVEETSYTEIETFDADDSAQADMSAFVTVDEATSQIYEAPQETKPEPEPPVEMPELAVDENSAMAKVKRVIESIDKYNEDMAIEILEGMLTDAAIDDGMKANVKKVKAMVECSMFAEAKELAQSMLAG